MGSTLALPTSFRMTIGMLVTGSIIRPRIFISTSMCLLHHGLTGERVRAAARHAHVDVLADELVRGLGAIMRKTQGAVARGASGPKAQRFMTPFDVDLFNGSDEADIVANLNGALLFLDDGEPSRFLFFRNMIDHLQRRGIRALGVFKAEDGIVLHFVEQAERLFEILF